MINDNFEHKCNFCNEKEALYYCNDCSLTFCNTCAEKEIRYLIICSNCFSQIQEFDYTEDIHGRDFKCPECKSIKYKEATKSIKLCPSCRSNNILTIAKKKKSFIKNIRNSVICLRSGYEKLNNLLSRMEKIKSSLYKLRINGYLHDFSIEKTIFELQETIPIIKDKITLKIHQDHQLLEHQLTNISNINAWIPRNFPSIEAVIGQVIETANSHLKYIDNSFTPLNNKLNSMIKKIKAINFFKKTFDEYQNSLILLPGELPVCAFRKIKFKKSTSEEIKSTKGTLFFTDRRIIFLVKKGILFKKVIKLFDFLFEGFERAIIKGRFFKRIYISLDNGDLVFSSKDEILKAILKYFNIAINFEKYRISDKISTQLNTKFQIDLMSIKNNIETCITNLLNFQNIQNNNSPYTFNRNESLNPRIRPVISNPFQIFESKNHINYFNVDDKKNEKEFNLNENEMILKLENEKFDIKNSISSLEDRFHKGLISSQEFLKFYRLNQNRLFKITEELEDIKKSLIRKGRIEEVISFKPRF